MNRILSSLKALFAAALLVGCAGVLAQDAATEATWPDLKQRLADLIAKASYDEALPLARQALAMAERAQGADHVDTALSLHLLASCLWGTDDYAAAEPLFLRSLAIREKALGPEHADVATSLNSLATLYADKGDIAKAEPLYQRALSIREKTLGPDDPLVAATLHNLGTLYPELGDYLRAEPLYLRALAIQEKALGTENAPVATTLNSLAVLYGTLGDYARAEPLYRRSIAVWEKVLGPSHPHVAVALNNLATIYEDQGDYVQAEPLYRRSLAIREGALGPDHPDVAISLHNLANLYRDQGDLARAEPLHLRSLAIWEKAFGPEHPDVAKSLQNLGRVYRDAGELRRAGPLFQRSLDIRRKLLGEAHPETASTLLDMAQLAWIDKDVAGAVGALARATGIEEHHLALILSAGAEEQKRAYAELMRSSTDLAVSLHLRGAPRDIPAARLAALLVLQRKGRVLDAMTDGMATLRRRLSASDQQLLDDLRLVRSRLAGLVLKGADDDPEHYRVQLAQLEGRQQDLEARISARSAEFRELNRPASLARVQGALPADAALIEWVVYRPVDPRLSPLAARSIPRRYAAFVLRARGEPVWFDLGDADAIDTAVSGLRAALSDASRDDAEALAHKLYGLVWQPMRARLAGVRLLLLSPDAGLNLVPFAALREADGRFTIERHTLAYLTTGRDLIRPAGVAAPVSSTADDVIVAAPDFDLDMSQQAAPAASVTRKVRRSMDMLGEHFAPLPGAQSEAQAVARLLPRARMMVGPAATTEALKQLHGPRLLHVATHAFFLSDPDQRRPSSAKENPLLRSGLALAGANRFTADGPGGILTALEAADLDLEGTELVVLSACETGVGEVRNGEGVYGLRRALSIAGAKSQVMSLWQVEDEATQRLMVDYYRRLTKGDGRAQALRQAQMALLHSATQRHPFYWAGFIPAGRWEPLWPRRAGRVARP